MLFFRLFHAFFKQGLIGNFLAQMIQCCRADIYGDAIGVKRSQFTLAFCSRKAHRITETRIGRMARIGILAEYFSVIRHCFGVLAGGACAFGESIKQFIGSNGFFTP